jgi:polysaccharide export outer membrane protein
MNTLVKRTVSILSLFALVAVHSNRAAAQSQPATAANPTSTSSAATAGVSRLHIGPGDLLNVSVFDVPELSQTLRVSDTGDVTLQLIGSLHVASLTTDQAGALIAGKLKDGNLIVNPQVAVLISEYSTQGVSVLGEVQKPGVYQVLGSRSLLDIISEAGGTTTLAGPDVTVKHMDGSMASMHITKNAETTFATDFELLPGDKVIIPRAGLIYVLGDVGRPGGFIMENDGRMTILQAVAMAGGPNRTASMNQAKLIRKTANGYSDIPVELKPVLQGKDGDVPLQAEDILYIPINTVKSAIYRTTPAILADASSAAIYRGIP